MKRLTIYILDDDAQCLYPALDFLKNSKENDVVLFFLKRKYPNPPVGKNILVFDFPEMITAEWFAAIKNVIRKVDITKVEIHSAIHLCEKINFPLLKFFQQDASLLLTLSFFLYETNFSDTLCRQRYDSLLHDGLSWQIYGETLQQKLISDTNEWIDIYNYLFSVLVDTHYFFADSYKNKSSQFFSISRFDYVNVLRDSCRRDVADGMLTMLGVDRGLINIIREVCDSNKTLFFVDDGVRHPLGHAGKDASLIQEAQKNGYTFLFLINYTGSLQMGSHAALNIMRLPENITLDALLLAGLSAFDVYGFCSSGLLAAKKESIKKIFLHESEGASENTELREFLQVSSFSKIPTLFINETRQRVQNGYKPKQIFLLAESMGDVLFAAGALNALRNNLTGAFVCIVPNVYHDLLSLCPWVDECWDQHKLNREQKEEIYIAQRLGHFHLPSHVKHILDNRHQIDSFLTALGYGNARHSQKEIVLSLDNIDKANVDDFLQQNNLTGRMVLIHPNVGVPNRTYPQSLWSELVDKFIAEGWSVILIGSNNNFYSHKKAVSIENERVFNVIDKFTMAESAYLMTKASLLVACDSGPVALAAVTDIAICALYSVVPGEFRLPYRHGVPGWNARAINKSCQYYHCASSYSLGSSETFDAWCPNNKTYSCMKEYTPSEFFNEIKDFLASVAFYDQCATREKEIS